MNVTFIASRGDLDGVERAHKLATVVEQLGHKVDTTMLDGYLEAEEGHLERAYKKHTSAIKHADVVIAEVTEYSTGIGFLIALALNERKQVICLHQTASGVMASPTLKGAAKSSLMEFFQYTEDTVRPFLKKYLHKIGSQLDTKFILILPPAIDKYLRWASSEKRLHKAQIVRRAVKGALTEDTDYQDFLQQMD